MSSLKPAYPFVLSGSTEQLNFPHTHIIQFRRFVIFSYRHLYYTDRLYTFPYDFLATMSPFFIFFTLITSYFQAIIFYVEKRNFVLWFNTYKIVTIGFVKSFTLEFVNVCRKTEKNMKTIILRYKNNIITKLQQKAWYKNNIIQK